MEGRKKGVEGKRKPAVDKNGVQKKEKGRGSKVKDRTKLSFYSCVTNSTTLHCKLHLVFIAIRFYYNSCAHGVSFFLIDNDNNNDNK